MTVQASFVATLVDEWVRAGVRHAVISPGSRSSPLSVALAHDDRIAVHVRLDERSGAFYAIGLARSSMSPVVVVTTSGTAAVELHPAMVEADLSGVPIIAVTSDRPFELHQIGASQTVEQSGLFGRTVRFSMDVGVPDEPSRYAWRSIASRLVTEATSTVNGPGPVHLNVAFREPLVDASIAKALPGRANGAPWHRRIGEPTPTDTDLRELCGYLDSGRRGIVVVGEGGCPGGDPSDIVALADLLGWPILADPRAFVRTGEGAVIAHVDGIYRSPLAQQMLSPDVIFRFGSTHLSKSLAVVISSLRDREAVDLLVESHGRFTDPERSARLVVAGNPTEVARRCVAMLAGTSRSGDKRALERSHWLDCFLEADAAVEKAIASTLDGVEENSEPEVIRQVFAHAAANSTVVVSASMPARDLEWFSAPRTGAPQVVFNGGANGIDGVISTALGVAAGAGVDGAFVPPVTAIVGDLAFFHDLSGLVFGSAERIPDVTLVVIDNNGGGIFSFLAQADVLDPQTFERIMATPQRSDCADVARALGCTVHESSSGSLGGLLRKSESEGGISVIVVRTNRASNRQMHAELERAISNAVDDTLRGLA